MLSFLWLVFWNPLSSIKFMELHIIAFDFGILGLFLHKYHIVLTTIFLSCILRVGMAISPDVLLLLRTVSAIQGLLWFHMNLQ